MVAAARNAILSELSRRIVMIDTTLQQLGVTAIPRVKD